MRLNQIESAFQQDLELSMQKTIGQILLTQSQVAATSSHQRSETSMSSSTSLSSNQSNASTMSSNELLHYQQLQQDEAKHLAEIDSLVQRNQQLAEELHQLQTSHVTLKKIWIYGGAQVSLLITYC